MEGFSIVSHSVILLACLMGVGFIAVKTGYISSEMKNMISKLIVRITLPCLILNSLTSVELDAARLKNSLFVAATAIISIILLYSVGTLVSKIFRMPPKTAFIHRCLTAFGNVAFLGFPLIEALYGAEGVFYAAFYTFTNDIFVWTFGVWRMSAMNGNKKRGFAETVKSCMSPPTVTFLITILMLIFRIRLSGIPQEVASGIGGTTTYLSMLFIGGTLAEIKPGSVVKTLPALLVVLFKMILVPILLIFVMKKLPFDPMVERVAIMEVAVPSQTILSIVTKEYGGDTDYVVKGIFITTVMGLITLPFIYYLLSM